MMHDLSSKAKRLYALYFLVILLNGVWLCGLVFVSIALVFQLPIALMLPWLLLCVGALYPAYLYFVVSPNYSVGNQLRQLDVRDIDMQDRHEKLCAQMVDELALSAGVMPPYVHIVRTHAINAATLRDGAGHHLLITYGATRLDKTALYGLIGHEYGHILADDVALAHRMGVLSACLDFLHDLADGVEQHALYHLKIKNTPYFFATLAISMLLRAMSSISHAINQVIGRKFFHTRELMADYQSVMLTRCLGVKEALLAIRRTPFRANLPIDTHLAHCCFADPDNSGYHPENDARIGALHNIDIMPQSVPFALDDTPKRQFSPQGFEMVQGDTLNPQGRFDPEISGIATFAHLKKITLHATINSALHTPDTLFVALWRVRALAYARQSVVLQDDDNAPLLRALCQYDRRMDVPLLWLCVQKMGAQNIPSSCVAQNVSDAHTLANALIIHPFTGVLKNHTSMQATKSQMPLMDCLHGNTTTTIDKIYQIPVDSALITKAMYSFDVLNQAQYDALWLLCQRFAIDSKMLTKAIDMQQNLL